MEQVELKETSSEFQTKSIQEVTKAAKTFDSFKSKDKVNNGRVLNNFLLYWSKSIIFCLHVDKNIIFKKITNKLISLLDNNQLKST